MSESLCTICHKPLPPATKEVSVNIFQVFMWCKQCEYNLKAPKNRQKGRKKWTV